MTSDIFVHSVNCEAVNTDCCIYSCLQGRRCADAGSTAPGSASSLHDRAFGTSGWGPSAAALRQKPQQAAAASSEPASVHIGPVSAADRLHQQAAPAPAFIKAKIFSGPKEGYIFQKGLQGVGYYLDTAHAFASAGKHQKQKSQGVSVTAEQRQQQQQQQQAEEGVREAADSDDDMQPVKGVCQHAVLQACFSR